MRISRTKWGFIIMTLFLVIAFPYRTQAINDTALVQMHYLNYDSEGKLFWEKSAVKVSGDSSNEDRAFVLFKAFFEGGQVVYMPEGVKLLSTSLYNGDLYVNVSGEIQKYGGSYYERCLKNQVIKTALHIPGVERITLLIDGKCQSLPEGSRVQNETEWSNLEDE